MLALFNIAHFWANKRAAKSADRRNDGGNVSAHR